MRVKIIMYIFNIVLYFILHTRLSLCELAYGSELKYSLG